MDLLACTEPGASFWYLHQPICSCSKTAYSTPLHVWYRGKKKFQTVKKTTPQTNKTKVTLHLHQGRLWLVFGLFVFAQEKDLR